MQTVERVGVRLAAGEREKMQESDVMELLDDGKGSSSVDNATEHIRLVSLGHNCGPKLSCKHLGRGAETLPFDWGRVKVEGLLHYMRNDFDGFFDFVTTEPVPGISQMVTYRDYLHSFWHDDPRHPGMHDKYCRRIERFHSIDAESAPVLFVRAVMSTDELSQATELLEELRSQFGPQAYLLMILSQQIHAKGAGIVGSVDHLIVYFLEPGVHNTKGYTVFADPISETLDWMIGRTINAMQFPEITNVQQCASDMQNGFSGLGGLPGFEEVPDQLPSQDVVRPIREPRSTKK